MLLVSPKVWDKVSCRSLKRNRDKETKSRKENARKQFQRRARQNARRQRTKWISSERKRKWDREDYGTGPIDYEFLTTSEKARTKSLPSTVNEKELDIRQLLYISHEGHEKRRAKYPPNDKILFPIFRQLFRFVNGARFVTENLRRIQSDIADVNIRFYSPKSFPRFYGYITPLTLAIRTLTLMFRNQRATPPEVFDDCFELIEMLLTDFHADPNEACTFAWSPNYGEDRPVERTPLQHLASYMFFSIDYCRWKLRCDLFVDVFELMLRHGARIDLTVAVDCAYYDRSHSYRYRATTYKYYRGRQHRRTKFLPVGGVSSFDIVRGADYLSGYRCDIPLAFVWINLDRRIIQLCSQFGFDWTVLEKRHGDNVLFFVNGFVYFDVWKAVVQHVRKTYPDRPRKQSEVLFEMVNHRNEYGMTPLICAAFREEWSLVRYLLGNPFADLAEPFRWFRSRFVKKRLNLSRDRDLSDRFALMAIKCQAMFEKEMCRRAAGRNYDWDWPPYDGPSEMESETDEDDGDDISPIWTELSPRLQ